MSDRWLYAWGLGSVAFGGASLLVPLYVVHLGGTAVHLGILASTAAVVGAPGALLFGRVGTGLSQQRRLLVVTLVTVALGLAAMPLVDSLWSVILLNAAIWFVSAGIAPVLTMLAVEGVSAQSWTTRIGRLNKYQGYGWAAGLILGTVWAPLAGQLLAADQLIQVLFPVLAVCALGSVLGVRWSLPAAASLESHRRRRLGRVLAQTNRGVRAATFAFTPNRLYWTTRGLDLAAIRRRLTPTLVTYLAAAALFFTGFAAFWAPLPLFLTEEGFGSGQVFGLYLASSLGSAVLYEHIGRLAESVDVRLFQAGALAARGLLFPGVVLLGGLTGVGVLLGTAGVAFVAIGVTWAVIAVVGTGIVTRLAPAAVRSEALGLHTAVSAVAGGVGGVLGGWLAGMGYWLAFGMAGGLVLTGSLLVLSLRVLSRRPAAG